MKTPQKSEVVEGRLVTSALATKGRSGKSATADVLGAYYDYLEVPWAGYCLDEVYRSFYSRHPEVKALTVTGPHGANELLKVFRTTLNAKGPLTTLADPPAQFADTFIETVNRVRYLALAKEKGTSKKCCHVRIHVILRTWDLGLRTTCEVISPNFHALNN